tara:strand:+ start:404 stop:616 length:213 start_codon:yes stop_codon:yes gene_type:complete
MTHSKIEKNTIYIFINNNWEAYAEFLEKHLEHRITIVAKMNSDKDFFAQIKQIHIRNKARQLTMIRPFEL